LADYRRPVALDRYREAIAEALRPARPFVVTLRGLTATPEAVLVQGFAGEDALNRARDLFRERFAAAGLDHSLDRRFRAQVAHLTVMRFCRPPAAGALALLAERIEELRSVPLGRIEVREVELVENDWYLSAARTELLGRFPLS
jgi:2'-5' RNA ligase